MAFRIELPAYRGPLDLLLYLVRRHEVSLAEMPLAQIVDQYLGYIEVLKELDMGDVGEFIDLASTLVELKSQSVLPRVEEESEEEEIEVQEITINYKLACIESHIFRIGFILFLLFMMFLFVF